MYTYKCTVVKIIDGDTIDVDIHLGFNVILNKQRIRLMGIDTPESRTRNLEEKARGLLSKEELKIFDDTGLYSVFFGEQISGPLMPSLIYMLAFESIEERNDNWKKLPDKGKLSFKKNKHKILISNKPKSVKVIFELEFPSE